MGVIVIFFYLPLPPILTDILERNKEQYLQEGHIKSRKNPPCVFSENNEKYHFPFLLYWISDQTKMRNLFIGVS